MNGLLKHYAVDLEAKLGLSWLVISSNVNKNFTFKAKASTRDLTFKAQAKPQDWTFKAKARTKNLLLVLKESLRSRPRPRPKTNITTYKSVDVH